MVLQYYYKEDAVTQVAGSLTPNTTAEQGLLSASQRKINLIWELTQATVAGLITLATVGVAAWLAVAGSSTDVPDSLQNSFFLVVGFYFGRTNQARLGDPNVSLTSVTRLSLIAAAGAFMFIPHGG